MQCEETSHMVKEREKDKRDLCGLESTQMKVSSGNWKTAISHLLCGREQSTGATNHWEKTMQSAWCEVQSLIPAGISSTLETRLCSH